MRNKAENKPVEILIVEDSPTQAEKLQYILGEKGYRIIAAANGKKALDLLRDSRPDIVISDVLMPEMDGYELCSRLRADERFKDIPVILLTTLSDPKDVIKGLECGANNFIVKPYDEKYLINRIQYLFANFELRKNTKAEMGINVFFSGENYLITAERLQILDLLLSTYENAYHQNVELIKVQNEMRALNERLEELVRERTAELVDTNKRLQLELVERKKVDEALALERNRLAAASRAAKAALWEWDIRSGALEWSDIVDSMLGHEAGGLPRTIQAWEELIHPDDRAHVMQMLERHLEQGTPYDAEYRVRTKEGPYIWFRDSGTCKRNGHGKALQMSGACTDITARKRVEKELLRMNRALKTISECDQALVRITMEEDLLKEMCRIVVDVGGYRLAMVGYAEHDEGKTVRVMASEGYEHGFFDNLCLTWADTPAGYGPIGTAIKDSAICVFKNIDSDQYPSVWREAAIKRGYGAAMGLPLFAGEEVFGALAIYAVERDAFDEQEMNLLAELAKDLSYGIGAIRDRQMRKEAEKALCENKERYKKFVESTTNYIYSVKLENDKPVSTTHSPGCVSTTGYSAEDFKADPYLWYRMIHEEDRQLVMERINLLSAGAEPLAMEHRILHRNGTIRWVSDTLVPRYEGGKLAAYDGLIVDITERKKVQEADVARLSAEAANRAKSDFLANMSHELRTPLNSILGFSEILKDELFGKINEKQHEYVGNIYDSGKHLLNLISDILDLSKVEAGKMGLEPGRLLIKDELHASLSMLKEKAMKHGVNLDCEIEPDADIELEADERKFKQIMYNLLSNAVKFTPEGGAVRVTARMSAECGVRNAECASPQPSPQGGEEDIHSELRTPNSALHGNFMEISVADTGIGIKPEDLPKLFHEFSQLESAYTKNYEGTGLGLALTKRLIELHGGRIWADSEFGKGSRFTFVIPVKHGKRSEKDL